jgi:hypothetical protein
MLRSFRNGAFGGAPLPRGVFSQGSECKGVVDRYYARMSFYGTYWSEKATWRICFGPELGIRRGSLRYTRGSIAGWLTVVKGKLEPNSLESEGIFDLSL